MMMTTSIRLMAVKGTGLERSDAGRSRMVPNGDNWSVDYLFGEWIPASVFLALAFMVAFIGVVGLGWYVMRGDRINRRLEGGTTDEGTRH